MKSNIRNNYLLAGCVLVLVLLCVLSISSPLRFEKERAAREQTVKQYLVKIRVAEEAYKSAHATYTESLDTLVKAGLLADSLKYIPFSGNKPFALAVSSVIGRSGRHIPLMECSAGYEQYLHGLDPNSVAALIEEATVSGQFPGLKIGDITEYNGNIGNWE
ncbi:MAG: hypothetical protein ACOYJK_01215 [Prevotella sp.]|jgi:hypothetical protein